MRNGRCKGFSTRQPQRQRCCFPSISASAPTPNPTHCTTHAGCQRRTLPSPLLLTLLAFIALSPPLPYHNKRMPHLLPIACATPMPHGSRIPWSTSAWTYFGVRPSLLLQRYWRSDHLTDALWAHGLQQFKPVLAKLERGEPLTVVAWGSSIVQRFGGCYHPSMDHLRSLVRHLPHAYAHQLCETTSGGWLTLFMEFVHTHWPHPNHTLINAGRAGEMLGITLRSCAMDEIPAQVDLMVLENMAGMTPGHDLEQVLWRALRAGAAEGGQRPAVVLLNSAKVVDTGQHDDYQECMFNSTLCDTRCGPQSAHPFATSLQSEYVVLHDEGHGPQHIAAQLGHYYGITVVSQRQFHWAMMRDGFAESSGWSLCHLFSRTYRDAMHPNELGCVLWADWMVNILRLAELYAHHNPQAVPPKLPTRPLYPNAHAISLTRCFMVDDDSFTQGISYSNSLQIVQRVDWYWVDLHVTPFDEVRYKPGYQVDFPGAVFTVRLDTTFPEALWARDTTRLQVTYLASYYRMGMVNVTCSGNCSCDPLVLDANHVNPTHKESIHLQASTPIRKPSPDCLVTLTVLNETHSEGHKFKVVNLVVTAQTAGQGTQAQAGSAAAAAGAPGAPAARRRLW